VFGDKAGRGASNRRLRKHSRININNQFRLNGKERGMTMNFKSWLHGDRIAYEIGEYSYEHKGVFAPVQEYMTYNDGMVKHSHSYDAQDFIDCLVSLYDYLIMANELPERIENNWPWEYRYGGDKIKFLQSLKYCENKRKFYNFNEKKVSNSPNKAYDKRWEEVPSYADGTFENTIRLMKHHCYASDMVNEFALFVAVKDWFDENIGYGHASTWDNNGLGTKDDFNNLLSAFKLVDRLVASYRERKNCERSRESLQWNLVDRNKQEEKAA